MHRLLDAGLRGHDKTRNHSSLPPFKLLLHGTPDSD